jgi:hypothetical protein
VFKLLSLSEIVGRISINAHMAPRMVKIKITNGSPEEKNEKFVFFHSNILRDSCCERLTVVVGLIRLVELLVSSSKFCSKGL